MFTRAIDRLIVRRVFSRVLGDAVRVGFGDDPVQPRSVGASQPSLVVHDAGRLLSAMLAEGAVGFAVAYMEGAWTTADLAGVLQAASMRIDARDDADSRTRWRGRWADNVRDSHDPRIREIGEHYDLGNEFYAAWLDASMSYSSAIFTDPSESLEHAQARKYERLCALVDLRPGDRVLEIGCGWGGFAHYAVEHHDVTVTGLTLSRRQAAYAVERIASAGLGDRARIRLLDFRDVAGTYDKVVSIEMIESVDETLWPPLFETIHRVLVPGGLAAMQAIVIDERYYESLLQRDDFIKRFIFPGGALPAVATLRSLVADAGLSWTDTSTHGTDYAETLHRWAMAFDGAWSTITRFDASMDERFRRMWRYYLAYCEAGFRTGRIDGIQFGMRKEP